MKKFILVTSLWLVGLALAQTELFGFQGIIALDSEVSANLPVDTVDGYTTYHTYSFTVPEGIGEVVVTLNGNGADVDLALNAGAEISSYDDADYTDASEDSEHSYTLSAPMPNTIYNVEVINQTDTPADYTLSLTGAAGTNGELSVREAANVTVGMLAPGQVIEGSLPFSDDPEFSSYHTYIVVVPEGASELVLESKGQRDLDLAVKFGADISDYETKENGGDWDYGDFRKKNNSKITVPNPQAGFWYIDVVNARDKDSTYTIEATLK